MKILSKLIETRAVRADYNNTLGVSLLFERVTLSGGWLSDWRNCIAFPDGAKAEDVVLGLRKLARLIEVNCLGKED
jgi:hypothetical protein